MGLDVDVLKYLLDELKRGGVLDGVSGTLMCGALLSSPSEVGIGAELLKYWTVYRRADGVQVLNNWLDDVEVLVGWKGPRSLVEVLRSKADTRVPVAMSFFYFVCPLPDQS
jgi:hypothetical protein